MVYDKDVDGEQHRAEDEKKIALSKSKLGAAETEQEQADNAEACAYPDLQSRLFAEEYADYGNENHVQSRDEPALSGRVGEHDSDLLNVRRGEESDTRHKSGYERGFHHLFVVRASLEDEYERYYGKRAEKISRKVKVKRSHAVRAYDLTDARKAPYDSCHDKKNKTFFGITIFHKIPLIGIWQQKLCRQ